MPHITCPGNLPSGGRVVPPGAPPARRSSRLPAETCPVIGWRGVVRKPLEGCAKVFPVSPRGRRNKREHSSVAQLAEHSAVNRRVAGSSPAGGAGTKPQADAWGFVVFAVRSPDCVLRGGGCAAPEPERGRPARRGGRAVVFSEEVDGRPATISSTVLRKPSLRWSAIAVSRSSVVLRSRSRARPRASGRAPAGTRPRRSAAQRAFAL